MRRGAPKRPPVSEELNTAIGLIWGRLRTFQFEEADKLIKGCLRIWPEEKNLILLGAYASIELACPLDEKTLSVLRNSGCPEWADLVLSRGEFLEVAK